MVTRDELLTGVTRFSAERHHCVPVELSRLVVFGFDDRGASHYGLGCGHNDEILSSDAQENLPAWPVSDGPSIERMKTVICLHLCSVLSSDSNKNSEEVRRGE